MGSCLGCLCCLTECCVTDKSDYVYNADGSSYVRCEFGDRFDRLDGLDRSLYRENMIYQ